MKINSSNYVPDLKANETQVLFQRHADYDRKTGSMALLGETYEIDYNYLNSLLATLSDEERENIYFLFISSSTKNVNGVERAVTSTNVARDVVLSLFEKYGISKSHVINNVNFNGQIKRDSNLVEPNMLYDKTGYFEFLSEKYGKLSKEFWIAFEEDVEKEFRMQVFGEGPDEIVDRAINYLTVIKRYSDYFHSVKKNSRLIVWSGTHYDLISPLVKQLVMGLDKEDYVGVDYNGGISLVIDKYGMFSTFIEGVYYDLGDLDSMRLHRHL